MPAMPLTSLAALINAGIFLALTINVIRMRRRAGVSLGDNGEAALTKVIRGQANAAEQMPLALILALLVELQGGPGGPLASALLAFTLGRVIHGIYFCVHRAPRQLRFYGMFLTLAGHVTMAALLFFTIFWM